MRTPARYVEIYKDLTVGSVDQGAAIAAALLYGFERVADSLDRIEEELKGIRTELNVQNREP